MISTTFLRRAPATGRGYDARSTASRSATACRRGVGSKANPSGRKKLAISSCFQSRSSRLSTAAVIVAPKSATITPAATGAHGRGNQRPAPDRPASQPQNRRRQQGRAGEGADADGPDGKRFPARPHRRRERRNEVRRHVAAPRHVADDVQGIQIHLQRARDGQQELEGPAWPDAGPRAARGQRAHDGEQHEVPLRQQQDVRDHDTGVVPELPREHRDGHGADEEMKADESRETRRLSASDSS